METNRLLIRPMNESDRNAFTDGIANRALRISKRHRRDNRTEDFPAFLQITWSILHD